MLARRQLGILLFDQVEVLDFCGPFEVFSVTRLVEGSHQEAPSPFQVSLISESGAPVLTTGGMKVLADFSFENCPELDILLVPGSWTACPPPPTGNPWTCCKAASPGSRWNARPGWSRPATSSPPPASPQAWTWPSPWWPTCTAKPSPARPPATWNTRFRKEKA